jgi:hypothetical protein
LIELAERVLPREVGGGPSDYQFAELDREGGSVLVLRIDPAVHDVDEARVINLVRGRLRRTEVGLLADEVWRDGSLRVERAVPRTTRSGKILAFEGLSPAD